MKSLKRISLLLIIVPTMLLFVLPSLLIIQLLLLTLISAGVVILFNCCLFDGKIRIKI